MPALCRFAPRSLALISVSFPKGLFARLPVSTPSRDSEGDDWGAGFIRCRPEASTAVKLALTESRLALTGSHGSQVRHRPTA